MPIAIPPPGTDKPLLILKSLSNTHRPAFVRYEAQDCNAAAPLCYGDHCTPCKTTGIAGIYAGANQHSKTTATSVNLLGSLILDHKNVHGVTYHGNIKNGMKVACGTKTSEQLQKFSHHCVIFPVAPPFIDRHDNRLPVTITSKKQIGNHSVGNSQHPWLDRLDGKQTISYDQQQPTRRILYKAR